MSSYCALFDSDYPWGGPWRAADIIKSLGLSEKEIDSLIWKNRAELLGIEKLLFS
jgi:predicted TIM-barrel fold metal-dependent hydrolase